MVLHRHHIGPSHRPGALLVRRAVRQQRERGRGRSRVAATHWWGRRRQRGNDGRDGNGAKWRVEGEGRPEGRRDVNFWRAIGRGGDKEKDCERGGSLGMRCGTDKDNRQGGLIFSVLF